jgi:hypothetical protein
MSSALSARSTRGWLRADASRKPAKASGVSGSPRYRIPGRCGGKAPDLIERAEDAADRLPDLFSDALEAVAPWLNATAEAIGEALPPVKAVLSIAKFLTRETNPQALGLLAVSVAYQSALSDAAKEISGNEALRGRFGRSKPVRLSRSAIGLDVLSSLAHRRIRLSSEA